MPGIFPFVGTTMTETEEKCSRLQGMIDPIVAISVFSTQLGRVDLSTHDPDGQLPAIPESNAGSSRQRLLIKIARDEDLTIQQLVRRVGSSRGHWQLVGTAGSIADQLQDWVENAADGFNVIAPTLPGGLNDFVRLVLPELRRRGLYRSRDEGTMLRQHLDLDLPDHPSTQRVDGPIVTT